MLVQLRLRMTHATVRVLGSTSMTMMENDCNTFRCWHGNARTISVSASHQSQENGGQRTRNVLASTFLPTGEKESKKMYALWVSNTAYLWALSATLPTRMEDNMTCRKENKM